MDTEKKRIGLFGGSFNPPHNGHVAAAQYAFRSLKLDMLLVIPTSLPPHKDLAKGSPSSAHRYRMTELAFEGMENVEVLDIELRRSGRSYTADTLKEIRRIYPLAEIFLIVGADMFLTIQDWYRPDEIFRTCTICALCRQRGQLAELLEHRDFLAGKFGADCIVLENREVEVSSTEVRKAIMSNGNTDLIPDKVMEYIRENRLYGCKGSDGRTGGSDVKPFPEHIDLSDPNLLDQFRQTDLYRKAISYVDPGRRPHVDGCIIEAVRLSNRWGEDPAKAAVAALLHDVTKSLGREEQLKLFEKYGIIPRTADTLAFGPLHAITGAEFARENFGVDGEIESAIRYHTTGRAGMSKLEMIIYLADYIEPTRSFDGVKEVRDFAYQCLELAMLTALSNTIIEVCSKRIPLSPDTIEAYNHFLIITSDSR